LIKVELEKLLSLEKQVLAFVVQWVDLTGYGLNNAGVIT